MEGNIRSGGVLKKKSSSGCLVIKKKGDFNNSGGGSGGMNVINKEKKRAKLVASVSGSSDENESLEFMRRKVNEKKLRIGSTGYAINELENSQYHRNNVGMEISGERKRSRLDLFEFDEYDEFDGKNTRNEYMDGRFKMVGHGGSLKEISVGSSNRNSAVDKRKQGSYFDGSSGGRTKEVDHNGFQSKGHELEDDESHMPISLLKLKYHQEKATQPIRLQGKNGVLKVMVNKKKKIDFPLQSKNINSGEVEERRGSGSEEVSNKDSSERLRVYQGSMKPEKSSSFFNKNKIFEKEKKEAKLEKVNPTSNKGHKARDREIEDTDTSLKLAPGSLQASSSKKVVKKEVERPPPPVSATPAKQKCAKEGKPKLGGSTEKQILREKIRQILIDAGWTIDYRPRRNRDYLDAVYINTNGTAYWSIIKAYEAFKKQSGVDNGKSKQDRSSLSSNPLPDSLIHKLTRRTKKKIEEETKRKRKEAGVAKSTKKSVVREASESSDSDQNDHKLQRRNLPDADGESEDDSADHSPKRKLRRVKCEKMSLASNSTMLQGRTSKIIGRCTLLVRGSEEGKELESDGYIPYTGKRTLLGWLIDSGTAQLSEKLQYMNRKRTRIMLEGWITRDGIHCGCCSKILTVSKFELHAGSKLRQPFQNIFLESGASLLQCQIDAWNRQEDSLCRDFNVVDVDGDDPDDDTCGICGDGGDLICCDSCPSTFHQTCLEIQMLPSGDWHCPNCTCKFCGDARMSSEENGGTVEQLLIRCSFCEKKYHKSCSEEMSGLHMTSNGTSFCSLKCQEPYDHLQKILGVKHELEAGFAWSIIQRTDVSDASHCLYHQRVECNSKLAVALSVMDECFMPIFDRRSGINMIHSVVYNCGSNFNRLNYRGFYTVILERGDEMIAAACIRIRGTCLAEMPFVATREVYRRQGMCRRLLSAIETELCSLKISHLIISAIPEHINTWTMVFGFQELENELKKKIKSMNMLVFPGTDMLQKLLVKQENSDAMDMKVPESVKDQLQLPEKSDIDSLAVHDRQVGDDSGACYETKTSDESDALDSCSPTPAFPSNDNITAYALDSVVKSEMENKEKEPCMENNTINMECVLINPTVNDNVKCFVEEALCLESVCKFSDETIDAAEAHEKQNPSALDNAKIASVRDNVDSPMKISEDTTPKLVVNNVSVESPSCAVLETSTQSTADEVNGENIASFPVTDFKGEASVQLPELNQPAIPISESKVYLSTEPSLDSDNSRCNGAALCTKENGEVSSSYNVQILNENQNTTPISTVSVGGEGAMRDEAEVDDKDDIQIKDELVASGFIQEADKQDAFDGKSVSPIHTESSGQST